MVKGWFNESRRHALARQGIRTGRKLKEPTGVRNEYEKHNHDFTRMKFIDTGQSLTTEQKWQVGNKIAEELKKMGYDSIVDIDRGVLEIRHVRLIPEKTGYNISPYSGRRGRILNWDDWVKVNNTINKVLNKERISANVKSLKGKFIVRQGAKAMTERDWEHLKYENVGSQMNPIYWRDAWQREK